MANLTKKGLEPVLDKRLALLATKKELGGLATRKALAGQTKELKVYTDRWAEKLATKEDLAQHVQPRRSPLTDPSP